MPPLRLVLLFAAFVFFVTMVQLNILTIAFDKLGLSSNSASLLFITVLVGSMVNVPLLSMKSKAPTIEEIPPQLRELYRQQASTGRTIVGVNVGGCVVPVAFCLYLLHHHPLNFDYVVLAVSAVSALSYAASRRIPWVGIGMPIFLAPLAAAIVSLALDRENAAPLAYISGTLGS